jgi:hypothetical protein
MNITLTLYHELRVQHITYSSDNDSWSATYTISDLVSGTIKTDNIIFDRNSYTYSWEASAKDIFERLVEHLKSEIDKKIKKS